MPDAPPHGQQSEEDSLRAKIGHRAQRKRRARRKSRPTAWFGLGMFGLIGWSVAIPTLIGVAIGLWIDARWPGRPSWTLSLLLVGVALGCLNAWYWVKQETKDA